MPSSGLLVMATIVPSSLILVTMMMEALRSSETSILTRTTWHNIPEDSILHSHLCENLKSYMIFYCSMVAHRTAQKKLLFSNLLHSNGCRLFACFAVA
jgi:hypothetical protein